MEIISKELIKPSFPTPDHLKTVKLSLLDQVSPPLYLPLIFFYEANELKGLTASTNRAQICRCLKQSLSNTLTLFYPLAGEINLDNFTIDCNDKGVEFVEARFQPRLSDVIHDPKPEGLHKYLPIDDLLGGIHGGSGEGTIFMVQVNFFDCGGFAVGVCLSHLVGDGASMVEFMNAWAATCRGQGPKCNQEFGAMDHYFPSRDLSDSTISLSRLLRKDKFVTRRLVFEKERIAALKEDARSKSSIEDPTRVEALSAFIGENLMDAEKCRVLHVVNIRSRARPRLESAFGNGCFIVATTLMKNPRSEMVSELRRAIRRIDSEYVRQTQEEDRYLSDLGELCDEVNKVEGFIFSSWCRFPTYEVDFGWGSPVWVCMVGLPLSNVCFFMSTKSGDGIEAWINLHPHNIEQLQAQFNLIGITN